MLKSCLGLRVVSLVLVSRISLRPSGPVFESNQYIYQNAQNRTPSVVQSPLSAQYVDASDCIILDDHEGEEHCCGKGTNARSVSFLLRSQEKIGDSAKVVIKQDMKGGEHKYGFNNNKREESKNLRKVCLQFVSNTKVYKDHGFSTCPPPPPPPPPSDASASPSTVKQTRKASCLRSLSTRPPGAERPVVHVDPATGKADGPHRKKLRTYLGIVACDKAEFEIPEASDSRTKRKLLQTMGERWRQFKSNLTRKWALAADQDGVEDTVCEKYGISKEKWAQFCQTHRDPSWEDVRKKAQAIQKQNTSPQVLSRGGYDYLEQKLPAEKTKKKPEEATQSGSIDGIIDPPSPVRCHVKWKMTRTKKIGEMTIEATKEIATKINSFEEQATQGSFVPHGCLDVLIVAIGRPEHPGRVCAAGAGVTIKQYFGLAPRTSRGSSSLPPEELQ
ncbi:hypothetical protein GmHk_12G034840 [Glycine max]|nr:hypothetical protein GmHk_12G034840 [Glycine max]